MADLYVRNVDMELLKEQQRLIDDLLAGDAESVCTLAHRDAETMEGLANLLVIMREVADVQAEEPLTLEQENSGSGSDFILVGDWCWITVNNISVHVHRTDEGVSVDLLPLHCEMGDSLGGTWGLFSEAEQQINYLSNQEE